MRFFSTAFALAAIPAAVLASTHTVTVGDGGALAFNPSNISAAVGDQINFEFHSKNHSTTQSTFVSPCTQAVFNGSAGVNSGLWVAYHLLCVPIGNATFANGSFPTWSISIQDVCCHIITDKLLLDRFHYRPRLSGSIVHRQDLNLDAQTVPADHCKAGMVFSINATPEKSSATFQAAAMASTPAAPAAAAASDASPANGAITPDVTSPDATSNATSPDASSNTTLPGAPDATTNDTVPATSAAPSDVTGGADLATPSNAPAAVPSSAAAPSSLLTPENANDPATPGVVAAAGSPTAAASEEAPSTKPNGTPKTMFARGAAGLLTVVAVGAALL
ncbi:hypothetical protein K439DRAFT_1659655 [Ramaria rubella]|nr:hypothetical protein K439DRAFT_1659655 [Ramaria rubella]